MFFESFDIARIINWAVAHHTPSSGLWLFVAEKNQAQLPTLLQALKQANIPCFGGTFMRLIVGHKTVEQGCAVARLDLWRSPFVVHDLHRTDFSLEHLPRREELPENHTLVVLADADALYLADFFTQLYHRFGNRVQYLGGGAGILGAETAQQRQCVFTSEKGMIANAAVLALVAQPCVVGAHHGWERLHGPLLATRSEGKILHELNWQPAFEVYRQVVEAQINQPLHPKDLGSRLSHGFPLGMLQQGAEDIVRLPSTVTEDGGMVCIGGIQANSVVHILHGQPQSVVQAADKTLASCKSQISSPPNCHIVVNCVTRYWFLEDLGAEELATIHRGLTSVESAPMIGALFKGEIASDGRSSLAMLNKSLAIGSFM
ncbi:FIST C-terminal domain-containing protein [filamentous cyanobacterium LEGE 11480]|uniref:FIST C-terminal domain-containing protein n=1 Tax=Romeriopsis navalis LEGE 11480 TaxID=2777977 RepID=A0A928Z3U2_9CYAN|nr:FIST C-terminal domain-containing protein [Romeriopsis navalis]MBE9029628.1 FIST C-terminal domain-containing protein [Romeriopsis navalis LEGE 11480]